MCIMNKNAKYNILKISIIYLFVCISTSAYSANDSILNYPIDTINGQALYRYAVQKGEGLYRVSLKFGLTQDEIMRQNPNIKADGLKLGQVLHIPIKNQSVNNQESKTENKVLNPSVEEESRDTSYIYHVIKPKETLFGLSKQYGVPIKQLEDLNPKLVPKLPAGKTLRIPRTVEAQKAADNALGEPQVISQEVVRTFSVQRTDTMLTSKNVFEQTLQTSTTPDSVSISENMPLEQQDMPRDTTAPIEQVSVWSDSYSTLFFNLQDSSEQIPMRIAYLLPIMIDAPKRDANMDRFLEFYEGSLLAINDLQKQGLRIESYIYDIEKNDITLQATLKNSALKNVDAIIGPAYPAQVELVAQFAKEERIPAIVPFTPNIHGLDTNQYLLRFNLSTQQDVELMMEYLNQRHNDIHVAIIDLEKDEESEFYKQLSELIKKNHISSVSTKVNGLRQALKSNKENLLLFSSSKIADIQACFTELSSLAWDYELSLIGQYSWGKSEIPVKMYYTSVFDANDTRKEDLYAEKFNLYYNYPLSNTRPRYDMLGYDITVFTLRLLYENQLNNQENKSIQEIIPTIDYKGIQSDIHFNTTSPVGGFINHGRVAERAADR